MAKSKKIDKDMGFRLKKARLDQKLTYDELSGYWFIFQNVRTIRSPLFLHLWKPIFVHIKPMRQNSRKISIFSGLFLNYSEEKQGGQLPGKPSTLFELFFDMHKHFFHFISFL